MARPLRRDLIGLSIRTGIGLRELEQYDVPTICQYMAMLKELGKPSPKPATFDLSKQQTPDEMMAAARAALGHLKE